MPVTEEPNIHLPLGLLEVGDSFFLPALSRQPMSGRLHRLAREMGITISCQMGIDVASGLYGMRVVRTR